MPPVRFTARRASRYLLFLLCVPVPVTLPALVGCASSPWKHRVLYSDSGMVLYAEHREEGGREAALGYLHPIPMERKKAAAILSQMAYRSRPLFGQDEVRRLLASEEVATLAEPLTQALGGLTPNERLRFLVMRERWSSAFSGAKATSGVIFMETPGVLNVVLERIRESVDVRGGGNPEDVSFRDTPDDYRSGDPLIPFGGSALRLDATTGERLPRWLEIDLAAVTPPARQTPEGARPAANAERATTAASPEARYRKLKAKIETLKRLRADGALTDEEYDAQLEKIMSEL